MRLVLLRHAIAEDRYIFHMSSGGAADSLRPLTNLGINRMEKAALGLYKSLDGDIQRVVTSPYTRALQTAELLLEAIPETKRPKLEVSDLLTPGCSIRSIQRWLEGESGTVVLVGHEPDMSWLMQRFTNGDSTQCLKFGKAAACMIEFKIDPINSFGFLRWFMSPAILRKLGSGSI